MKQMIMSSSFDNQKPSRQTRIGQRVAILTSAFQEVTGPELLIRENHQPFVCKRGEMHKQPVMDGTITGANKQCVGVVQLVFLVEFL